MIKGKQLHWVHKYHKLKYKMKLTKESGRELSAIND